MPASRVGHLDGRAGQGVTAPARTKGPVPLDRSRELQESPYEVAPGTSHEVRPRLPRSPSCHQTRAFRRSSADAGPAAVMLTAAPKPDRRIDDIAIRHPWLILGWCLPFRRTPSLARRAGQRTITTALSSLTLIPVGSLFPTPAQAVRSAARVRLPVHTAWAAACT